MDLKEFVKETIQQVVFATIEANEMLSETGARVKTINMQMGKPVPKEISVDFDVAITATESEEANGSAGLKVASILNIGGGVDSKTENQTISHVKFTLPLVLPNKKK